MSALDNVSTAQPPLLFGRDQVLSALGQGLKGAMAQKGGGIALEGDPGSGRTRMGHEVERMAKALGFTVFWGHQTGTPLSGYGPLGEVLLTMLDAGWDDGPAAVLSAVLQLVQDLDLEEPDSHYLCAALGLDGGTSPLDHLEGALVRANIQLALRNTILRKSRHRPLLIILDGLEDPHQLLDAVLESLFPAIKNSACLVVVLHGERYSPPPGFTDLFLAPLNGGSLRDLLTHLGGQVPTETAVEWFLERTHGNPGHVHALAHHLRRKNYIAASADQWRVLPEADGEDVPRSRSGLLLSEVDSLEEGPARVMENLATCSVPLYPKWFKELPDLEGVDLVLLSDLVQAGLAQHSSGSSVVPASQELMAACQMSLSPQRRQRLHQQWGEYLAGLEFFQGALFAGARHLQLAGDPDRPQDLFLGVAQIAEKRGDLVSSDRAYQAYLNMVPDITPERIDARNEWASKVLHVRGDSDIAAQAHRTALKEAESIGDQAGIAKALNGLCAQSWELGRMERAAAYADRALRLARENKDQRAEGEALGLLANIKGDSGDLDGSNRLYEQAIALHRETGNRRAEGVTLANMADSARLLGNLDESLKLLQESLVVFQEMGNQQMEGFVRSNLANTYMELGQVDQARAEADLALRLQRKVGDRPFAAYSLVTKAVLARRTGGALVDAANWLLEAENMTQECGDSLDLMLVVCEQGHIKLAMGKSPDDLLDRARQLSFVSQVGEESEFGRALARLERAKDAMEAGKPLTNGECLEDLPTALRSSLGLE